jgi:hypothetical protein
MSHLDDLYKESGIGENPNKPRQKGPLISILLYLLIYSAVIAYLYFNGSFGKNPNMLYYVLIAMSFLFTFSIRKIIKKSKGQ